MNTYPQFVRAANGKLSWRQFAGARDAKAERYAVSAINGQEVRFSDGVRYQIPSASAIGMNRWGEREWCRWRAVYGGIEPGSRRAAAENTGSNCDDDGREPGEYRAALQELTGRNW